MMKLELLEVSLLHLLKIHIPLFANRSSSISSSISTSTSSSDEEREPVVEHDPFVEGILQKVMTTGLDEKKIQKLARICQFL